MANILEPDLTTFEAENREAGHSHNSAYLSTALSAYVRRIKRWIRQRGGEPYGSWKIEIHNLDDGCTVVNLVQKYRDGKGLENVYRIAL